MHEGALGATTDNPFWGRCDNPAAPGRTPGGSSGGSAAAVAAGFVPVAIGTDTMGSVRIPAAYCGLWAVKPTPGVIPTGGLRFLSRSLDTIGPIAATADDLRLACGIMAGLDLSPLLVPLRELVLGIPAEIREVDLVARLKRRGTTIRTVSVAGWEPGRLRRAGLLLAEAEAAEEFGADLDRGGAGFSDMFRALVDHGRRADPERLAAARARLATARSATAAALASVDALLMPTAPQKPFPHGAAVPANQADVTALANAAGLPAVAFPIPDMGEGVPASAQLLGAPNHEAGLLAIAEAVAGA
jgi:aspartyl-tRNA(Asn)/glutamyl-tRNA(Gln) amidotransferase subunit A